MWIAMLACEAPDLIEISSPMLNQGESEPAFYYEGEGVLSLPACDGPGLSLEVGPGLTWPHVSGPDELVEVWVVADGAAEGGEWWCELRAGMRRDQISVLLVEL